MTSSLEVTDQESAAVAVAPRVRLQDIEDAVASILYVTGDRLAAVSFEGADPHGTLPTFTLCLIVMRNGFIVVGKAAPASPENFDPELGRKFAYEDAIRQLWPLMGFALRDRLVEASNG